MPSDFDLQCSSLEHVEEAAELLPPIEARLRQAMVDALGANVADRYFDGLPSWQHTPGYFNIPMLLWLRSLVLAYDMHEYGRYRYKMIGRNGHWVPGMNAAHLDEWDLTGVLKDSPFAEQIPGWLRETHEMLSE